MVVTACPGESPRQFGCHWFLEALFRICLEGERCHTDTVLRYDKARRRQTGSTSKTKACTVITDWRSAPLSATYGVFGCQSQSARCVASQTGGSRDGVYACESLLPAALQNEYRPALKHRGVFLLDQCHRPTFFVVFGCVIFRKREIDGKRRGRKLVPRRVALAHHRHHLDATKRFVILYAVLQLGTCIETEEHEAKRRSQGLKSARAGLDRKASGFASKYESNPQCLPPTRAFKLTVKERSKSAL